jgi:hypothetical protein
MLLSFTTSMGGLCGLLVPYYPPSRSPSFFFFAGQRELY